MADLTNEELRASPVEVSLVHYGAGSIPVDGTIRVSNLPETVPVSNAGTFAVQATLSAETTKVIGTVNQGTSPWIISGTVTANAGTNLNTSLLALESGGNLATIAGKDFATQTTLALIKAKTDNIDVALSTRTKPADQQHVIVDSGTVTVTEAALDAALIAQEATTSGVKGITAFGAVTTAAPSYTTAKSDALSLTTSGALRVDIGATSANVTAIKVDGSAVTQPVSGTFFQATQPVSIAATVNVSLAAETTKVIGTVNQGTSPWVTNDPGLPNALGQSNMAGSTSVVLASDQSAIPISGTITATPTGTQDVNLLQVAGSTTGVAGSGVIGAGTQRVVLATDQPTVPVSLASVPSHAVTNAGTFAVQESGAALTSLQLIDDVVTADDAARNKSMVIGAVLDDTSTTAVNENNAGYLRMSQRRALLVEGISGVGNPFETNTKFINSASINVGTGAASTGTQRVAVASDSSIILAAGSAVIGHVIADSGSTTAVTGNVTVVGTGTFAVQATIAAGATNIAKAEDAASADGDVGVPAMAIQKLTPINTAGTDGDYAMLQMQDGRLWTYTTIPAGATTIAKGEDVPSLDGDVGVPAMAIRKATPVNTSGSDGDYEMLQMSAGRLWASATIDAALPAGTNLLGKMGIDQTTPGTTNAVSLTQIGATTVATGNGVVGTGVQRVSIASDNSPVPVSGTLTTSESAPTTIFNGKTTVTTAGMRVTLAASTTAKSVTIKALAANTGTIYVGNATVAAANGHALAAGESTSLDIANLNTVNLDSSVNGEGVTYLGVN